MRYERNYAGLSPVWEAILEEVYKNLWIGDDTDYLKIKDRPDWVAARMCKYGPGGHQQTLGYTTPAAPKGKNYLYVEKPEHLAVNILDLDDPNMIPFKCITTALDYIKKHLEAGKKVLVACNKGHSRGPTTGLLFLRAIGDLPYHFVKAEQIFKTLYPKYDPGMGIRQVAKEHWSEIDGMELK